MELVFYLSEFERADRLTKLADTIDASSFRLGCTPIVNLFKQNAEPLQITHRKTEYQVIPDIRRPLGSEVYSVDAVRKLVQREQRAEIVACQPLFGLHHANEVEAPQTFWVAARRPGMRANDPGSDVYLSLVDRDFDPGVVVQETLSAYFGPS